MKQIYNSDICKEHNLTIQYIQGKLNTEICIEGT